MSVFKYVRDAAFQKKIEKVMDGKSLSFALKKMENNRKQLRKVSNQNE